jgi:signal peptidase II
LKIQEYRRRLLKAGILMVLLVVIDQVTKIVADIILSEQTISVIGEFFQLDLAYNPGFGFSLGTGWPQWLTMAVKISIPLLAAIFTIFRLKSDDCTRLEALSLTLLTSGAFGNLIDRLVHGYVIDFLLFKMYGFLGFEYWPTFNIADVLIVSGTIGFALTQFLAAIKEHKAEKMKSGTEVPVADGMIGAADGDEAAEASEASDAAEETDAAGAEEGAAVPQDAPDTTPEIVPEKTAPEETAPEETVPENAPETREEREG